MIEGHQVFEYIGGQIAFRIARIERRDIHNSLVRAHIRERPRRHDPAHEFIAVDVLLRGVDHINKLARAG